MILILQKFNIQLPFEVKNEFLYRFQEFSYLLDYVTLLPKTKLQSSLQNQGFDFADIALIQFTQNINSFVITEDHPMLTLNSTLKAPYIQLADFFLICFHQDLLDDKETRKLIKYLRKVKNITKLKHKKLLEILRI